MRSVKIDRLGLLKARPGAAQSPQFEPMDSREMYRRAAEIFLEICDLGTAARARVLERVCRGDSSLQKEVESLLAYHGPGTVRPMVRPSARRPKR